MSSKFIKMEKYIVEVPLSERDFFLELLKRLPKIKFQTVEINNVSTEKQQIIDDLTEALKQVKLHKEGKIQLQDAHDFLAELKTELNYEQISH